MFPTHSEKLIKSVVKTTQQIRKLKLSKNPSIRATIDWIRSLMILGKKELDEESFDKTLNVAIKSEEDAKKVRKNIKIK